jgi:hypothetical protein
LVERWAPGNKGGSSKAVVEKILFERKRLTGNSGSGKKSDSRKERESSKRFRRKDFCLKKRS